jgi:hypothetical protein
MQTQMTSAGLIPQDPMNAMLQFDLSQFNPFGVDSISDAWYGQHLGSLDGLQGMMNYTSSF